MHRYTHAITYAVTLRQSRMQSHSGNHVCSHTQAITYYAQIHSCNHVFGHTHAVTYAVTLRQSRMQSHSCNHAFSHTHAATYYSVTLMQSHIIQSHSCSHILCSHTHVITYAVTLHAVTYYAVTLMQSHIQLHSCSHILCSHTHAITYPVTLKQSHIKSYSCSHVYAVTPWSMQSHVAILYCVSHSHLHSPCGVTSFSESVFIRMMTNPPRIFFKFIYYLLSFVSFRRRHSEQWTQRDIETKCSRETKSIDCSSIRQLTPLASLH